MTTPVTTALQYIHWFGLTTMQKAHVCMEKTKRRDIRNMLPAGCSPGTSHRRAAGRKGGHQGLWRLKVAYIWSFCRAEKIYSASDTLKNCIFLCYREPVRVSCFFSWIPRAPESAAAAAAAEHAGPGPADKDWRQHLELKKYCIFKCNVNNLTGHKQNTEHDFILYQ